MTLVDLRTTFPAAETRTTVPEADQPCNLETVTIAGVRRESILARPTLRLTWTVTNPKAAILETAFGLRENAWDRAGSDGAQFRISVWGALGYKELMRQYVNPGAVASDRK